jgi:hypothetical protein
VSLLRRVHALARGRVPFDEAERLLRADVSPRQPRASAAERAREERREWAELHGLDVTAEIAREARLTAWLGFDLAPPPEGDDDDA